MRQPPTVLSAPSAPSLRVAAAPRHGAPLPGTRYAHHAALHPLVSLWPRRGADRTDVAAWLGSAGIDNRARLDGSTRHRDLASAVTARARQRENLCEDVEPTLPAPAADPRVGRPGRPPAARPPTRWAPRRAPRGPGRAEPGRRDAAGGVHQTPRSADPGGPSRRAAGPRHARGRAGLGRLGRRPVADETDRRAQCFGVSGGGGGGGVVFVLLAAWCRRPAQDNKAEVRSSSHR